MASLQKTKGRLALVENISKITHAMELVATSKLRRVQDHHLKIQAYLAQVKEFMNHLTEYIKIETLLPRYNDRVLYVVVSSDLGLAGAYNSDIYKILNAKFDPQKDGLILIGKKAYNYYRTRRANIVGHFVDFADLINFKNAEQIGNLVMENYHPNKFGSVQLLYAKFINVITTEKVFKELIPFNKSTEVAHRKRQVQANLEFLPDPETVFKKTLPLYINSYLYGALAESKVSETSSRRVAMESATKNAGELRDNLVLEYNRVRQSKITQEIAEIISGAQS